MRNARITCDFNTRLGPLGIRDFSVGQGGLSPEPMWDNRVADVRALNPNLVRFWVQEYFGTGRGDIPYDLEAIDKSVRMVLATGGTPLISLNMKPRHLYPNIDERVLEPTDWTAWQELIEGFVRHFTEQGHTGWYWEIIGETDCGEGGGCPFLGTPETYPPFYEQTAMAVLGADPTARVGGPGLGYAYSPILPALLDHCVHHGIPLHFVSWHIYTTDPMQIRATIDHVKGELAKRPTLDVETVLDEWSVVWESPESRDPRFLPCFIPEVAWHMKEAGLDHSCYYHIRDYHVDRRSFEPFFTKTGAAFMARWWNRMPQWGGLFDFHDTVRPAYFAFKMLKRLEGERLSLESDDDRVHGFLTYDADFGMYVLMFWNFSPESVCLNLQLSNMPDDMTAMPFVLDTEDASNDVNRRIKPLETRALASPADTVTIDVGPYGVHTWYLKGEGWNLGQ